MATICLEVILRGGSSFSRATLCMSDRLEWILLSVFMYASDPFLESVYASGYVEYGIIISFTADFYNLQKYSKKTQKLHAGGMRSDCCYAEQMKTE